MVWTDARRVHLLTRGNVDGITAAGLVLARWPDARVRFVTNATIAAKQVRKDIGSDRFVLVDLGLEHALLKVLNRRARAGCEIALLDHHQQSLDQESRLDARIERRVEEGTSAAAVTRRWLGLPHLEHLAAIADVVEYCPGPDLHAVRAAVGDDRLVWEARMLDYAWRLQVADDRFRLATAHRLARGDWPSDIPEVRARYMQMCNERRWERALERVRQRVRIAGDVAMLVFDKRKPSLFGFGARALTTVAREEGCSVALLVHRRGGVASISARLLTRRMRDLPSIDEPTERTRQGAEFNLGRFLRQFTLEHGIIGGGHPESAGGKIPSRLVDTFVDEIACFA